MRRLGSVVQRQDSGLQNQLSRFESWHSRVLFDQQADSNNTPVQPVKKHGYFFILQIGFVCVIIIIIAFGYQVYFPHTAFRGKKEVIVAPGMGSRVIGDLLKQEGVIVSKWAFVTYVSIRGEALSLKPGHYEFLDKTMIPEIVRDLIAGASRERAITIPEGWNTADIARYFAEQNIAPQSTVETFLKNPPDAFLRRFSFLSALPQGMGVEGYLFPDTYRVFDGTAISDIVVKMLDNFDRKITTDLRQEITQQKKTLHEIITLASLIEKEVAGDDDRAIVSGILWKRLAAGIPLQVDATVIYAKSQLGNGVSKLNNAGNANSKISLADTKIDSPYNTYKYRGMPSGPIANPGISAIRAAVYPKASPYLYYLSAPDGRTIFSRTLDEHNAAKAKYLR